ncbi:MAG: DNA translocase FtsK 4TM domain-containing protein [Rhodobacteraceae bacterium]|nr:DNA translocase FtsK 4TM domain-containing protein [Paracoccaceae bacterium]
MASYNIDKREPLLDSNLQALLQKRGRELAGLALIGVAILVALMLGSYAPNDPGWMSASEAPVQNSLGRVGATLASPLMVILGLASWGLMLFLCVWGMRLVLARGHEVVLARMVMLPLGLAAASVWMASFVPGAAWALPYGLGGIFGDTVLGAVVNALPMTPAAGVTLMSVLLLAVCMALWGYVLGVSLFELIRFGQFLLAGLVLIYAGMLALMRGGVTGGLRGARMAGGALRERIEHRRAYAPAAEDYGHDQPPHAGPGLHRAGTPPAAQRRSPPVIRAETAPRPAPRPEPLLIDPAPYAQAPAMQHVQPQQMPHAAPMPQYPQHPAHHDPAPASAEAGGGLLSRLKSLSLRGGDAAAPMPELVERPGLQGAEHIAAPSPDRISNRIADAIRHRQSTARAPRMAPPQRPMAEPPLKASAQPQPQLQPGHAPAPAARITAEVSAPYSALTQLPDWMQAAPAAPRPAQHPPAAPDMAPQAAPRGPHVLQRRVVTPAAAKPRPSRQAQAEAQPALEFEPQQPVFELPPLSLLENPEEVTRYSLSDEALEENARMLENVLDDYGVRGEIVSVRPGPVVTQYELEPAPGLKASRVIGLADDIARSMSALSARVSTVPGRSIIGIELPNEHREKVVLREILAQRDYGDSQMRLPLALGKAIDGTPVVANLAKMPHLLIAGTTGSGKSVAINTMILSLLYRLSPEECRLIMIDPKMLELSVYDGIPHLLSPVVTDPKKAVVALKWVVGEMEERYRKMSKMGVRNIDGYNGRVRDALEKGEMFKRTIQTGFDDETGDPVFETEEFAPELLPYIVVIVDEMADLMMVAGKEIEACIQRLAQMARASGIHLIMATQRPSVDVITGTIKANFPTRISFQVTSKIDSRTILGEQGAEQLLGMGDMLYMAGGSRLIRVHGPFVSDEEVEEVVTHLKSFGPPDYKSGVVDGPETEREADIDAVLGLGGNTSGEDALYDQAVQVVIQDRKCSTSYIQRKLGIGYNKAARLVEQMEDEGLVTPANHVGKREILVPEQG